MRMIGLATIDTPHSCTAAKCGTTALGGLILVLQAGIVCQLNNKRNVCSGQIVLKTILWARTRNIDSKSEPRTQFRFKQLAVRI